jgi:hypothetical protein
LAFWFKRQDDVGKVIEKQAVDEIERGLLAALLRARSIEAGL